MAYFFKDLRQGAIDGLWQKVLHAAVRGRLILRPYVPVSAGLRVIGIRKQARNSDAASGCLSRIGTPKQLAQPVGITDGQI
jgi:hypothetical protein